MKIYDFFNRFSNWISFSAGHPFAFLAAVLLVAVWAITGPVFNFNDTWQLVINTGTTIVTFLMVFLIQNTQNRDGRAIQLELDELIRSVEGAHNAVIGLEDLSEAELRRVRDEYARLADRAREEAQSDRGDDTNTPLINIPVEKPSPPRKNKKNGG